MSSSGIGSGKSFRIERWSNRASPSGMVRRSLFMRALSLGLPPLVDRDGFLIGAAHDAPVAVGLAPHDHDMDIFSFKDPYLFVGRGLELGGPRLLAEGRARVDVVPDELVVPVLARRHPRRVVEPVDQRVLLREPAALDELARGDGIEQK